MTGSSDLFGPPRPPSASVNYVTSHDGPTLVDLVTYQKKHNEANGEANHDGHHDQRAWNTGVEGPTDDPAIRALRDRRRRSLLATLLVGRGVPMICGGDELGRTQRGNDNAYCQDNETSWHDWAEVDAPFLEFVTRLVGLRSSLTTLHPEGWLHGEPGPDGSLDAQWLGIDGAPVTDWHDPALTTISLLLSGTPDVLLVAHTGSEAIDVALPGGPWTLLVDTTDPDGATRDLANGSVTIDAHGFLVLAGT